MYSLLEAILCLSIVAVCIKPLGSYMACVYMGKAVWLQKPLGWLEHLVYRLCGIDPIEETGWRGYAVAVLALGLFGFLALFTLFLSQGVLPLNPQGFAGLSPDLAFNAAMSFVSNTNWQSYSGEASLSYLSQMAGCAVQNFLSAATGMAVAAALFRAFSRKKSTTLGNPYADITRGVLYILLPLSCAFALLLASQGVVQTIGAYVQYAPLEMPDAGCQVTDKKNVSDTCHSTPDTLIAVGPAASQVAIKMLGSNGGGFFNANGAHPFENPTAFSNLLHIVAILLIPAALIYTFGVMVGDRRQGWVLLAAMTTIFLPLALLADISERGGNPRLAIEELDVSEGNLEGKELRFGVGTSVLWAVATTATSNGSVNSMHDSYLPLTGMIPLVLIQFGEVIYGGVGSGAFGMLVYVLLTVFIGGLMVGRTPEYLGKKLGPHDIKMASLVIIFPALMVLGGTALAVATEAGRAGVLNPGAQGFTEILYAFASASNNNGSAFAGLSANSVFYNTALGICMFVGRYFVIVPVLALAGSLAAKNTVPAGPGTLPTHTPLFMVMLVGTIILLDVLTYVPSLALGPLAEHMALFYGSGAP